jgi:hypothetical protein
VCETGDYLALDRRLPPFAAGDLIAFMTAGAYGATMSSTYNTRSLVPEVLVKGDAYAVVRPRPSYDELIGMDRLPGVAGVPPGSATRCRRPRNVAHCGGCPRSRRSCPRQAAPSPYPVRRTSLVLQHLGAGHGIGRRVHLHSAMSLSGLSVGCAPTAAPCAGGSPLPASLSNTSVVDPDLQDHRLRSAFDVGHDAVSWSSLSPCYLRIQTYSVLIAVNPSERSSAAAHAAANSCVQPSGRGVFRCL